MGSFLLSRAFLLCFGANLLQATAFSLYLHFPGFLQQLGASTTGIGVIAALTALSAIVLSPLIGRVLDTSGRRVVILVASGLNVGVCGAFLFVDTLGAGVILLRMLHGAAEMALNVAFFTYAVDVIPLPRRSQGLALFGISAMGAVGLGAVLGDLAFGLDGYRGVFLASLGLSGAAGAVSVALAETRCAPERPATRRRSWTGLLLQRDLWGVWMLTAAFFFSMSSVFVYMKTWVLESGIGSVGLYFAVYSGTAISLRVFFGQVPDRLGAARAAAPTLLLYAVGFLVLAGADSTGLFILAAVLGGIGHGYGYPVLLTLVADRAGSAGRGSGVAVYGAIDDGAVLVAAPVLGFVIEASGHPAMYLAAGTLVVLTVVAYRLNRSSWPSRPG